MKIMSLLVNQFLAALSLTWLLAGPSAAWGLGFAAAPSPMDDEHYCNQFNGRELDCLAQSNCNWDWYGRWCWSTVRSSCEDGNLALDCRSYHTSPELCRRQLGCVYDTTRRLCRVQGYSLRSFGDG